MKSLSDIFNSSDTIADYADRYFARMQALLAGLDRACIAACVERMAQATEAGNTLYFIANGGSAAVASHVVNDLVVGSYQDGKAPFKAWCLSDNIPSITAIANDYGFEDVFKRQLQVHVQPGDVVVAMSVSGNSENIIRAVDYAREAGAVTIGLCGFDGGKLAQAAELVLHAPSAKDEYGPVEDFFAIGATISRECNPTGIK